LVVDLLLLATAGLAVIGTTALSTVGAGGGGSLGVALRALVLVAAVVINAVVFTFAFRLATSRRLTLREVLPGALTAAVLWQLLQTFGVTYVSRVMDSASAVNGVFALVLGLLAFSTWRRSSASCAWRSTWCASTGSTRARCSPPSPRCGRPHGRRSAQLHWQGEGRAPEGLRDGAHVTFDQPDRDSHAHDGPGG
jgi:hypothetical protein